MLTHLLTLALTATTTTAVSLIEVNNYCPTPKFITLLLNTTGLEGPFELPSGQAEISQILGTGNQLLMANEAAPFGAEVPRLSLGTSTDGGVVYWAVNNLTGDPFAGLEFNITSSGSVPDICQHVTFYDHLVHACSDNDVTLTLNLCSNNP